MSLLDLTNLKETEDTGATLTTASGGTRERVKTFSKEQEENQ